ncbi:protein CLEC16A-like [Diadema setosum]|uniref:protein CLEC16A-like n=1 Tax=Diadema setosum TaxID=31175 RepID=UPI003B39FE9C
MFSKPKGWFGPVGGKPKNVHSLEHLRLLHGVLMRNATVTEQNRSLLVETLRSISEILIWGDQNDSSVFDFFLEKNMLLFFLKILRQKTGSYICVQLLQTLNILFENIRNETSLYYLLSNNHVNSIIVHKFDFSDEEVLAYYISFLKTLSFKLNKHTIHFFYNEHTNDFALYTEAIKFFNHPESMVRIAVRTLTLNVYKVNDKAMLMYIRNKTAVPYFSNLVWFIGNHVLELDSCVRNDIDHQSKNRLSTLVAEHLDHLHYLNDILNINIEALNDVLTDHLLNRLLLPLYVASMTRTRTYGKAESPPAISSVVALFLLSQVFLIMRHQPLVCQLAYIIFNGNHQTLAEQPTDTSGISGTFRAFVEPAESLEYSLDSNRERNRQDMRERRRRPNYRNVDSPTEEMEEEEEEGRAGASRDGQERRSSRGLAVAADDEGGAVGGVGVARHRGGDAEVPEDEEEETPEADRAQGGAGRASPPPDTSSSGGTSESDSTSNTSSAVLTSPISPTSPLLDSNSTDEEKSLAATLQRQEINLSTRPYFACVLNSLDCNHGDYRALFALCLLYAMGSNEGIKDNLLEGVLLTNRVENKTVYNSVLVERLIALMNQSCQLNSCIRPVTLEMACLLLKQLIFSPTRGKCFLEDRHLACVEGAKEESVLLLRNFYRGDELFLDMFDDEYESMKKRPLNVEYLMMDESILLHPTGTPLTGIDFSKRLPSGELERTRRAIRAFFLLRDLSLTLCNEVESKLPLIKPDLLIKLADKLDLNNSDLIACSVILKDKSPQRVRRFLVIAIHQLILVEPDSKKLGWGVAKFVGPLQDLEVTGDKDDSRSLQVTVHKRSTASPHAKPVPLLAARFQFDDHIRCMAAKQRLTKGRLKARQAQMACLAELLEIPLSHHTGLYGSSSAISHHPGMAIAVGQPSAKSGASSPSPARAKSGGGPPAAGPSQHAPSRFHQAPPTSRDLQQGARSKGHADSYHGDKRSTPRAILSQSRRDSSPSAARHRESPVEQAQEALSPSAFTSDRPEHATKCTSAHQSVQSEPPHMLPPTLAPSKAPPVSLIKDERPAHKGGSPKILPPASTERVRSLSLTNQNANFEPGAPMQALSTSSIPFSYEAKTPPRVDVNPASASPQAIGLEKSLESATERLRKLSSSWGDDTVQEKDGIEMRTMQHGEASGSYHGDGDDADVGDAGSSVDGSPRRMRYGSDVQDV